MVNFFLFVLPLALFMIFILIPFVWAVLTSLKTQDAITGVNMRFFPDPATFDNYAKVWQRSKFSVYFGNSLLVSSISVVFIVVLSICNGYALSRYKFKGKNAFTMALIATQLMPVLLFVIPLFVIFRQVGLINTPWALVLFYIGQQIPFNSILMRGFVSGIPVELEEAAWVDGASRPRTLASILLPMLLPGIVATGAFAFVSCWNEFTVAFAFTTRQSMFTIPVGLRYMIGEYSIDYGSLAAGSIIALIPPVALFAYIQKYLVQGLGSGAVKG